MKQQILALSILTLASSMALAGGAGEESYSYFCVNYATKTAVHVYFKKRDPIHIGSNGYLYVDGKMVRDLSVTVNDPKLLQLKSAHDETKADIKAEFIFANENDEKASMLRIQTGDQVQELTDINCMTF